MNTEDIDIVDKMREEIVKSNMETESSDTDSVAANNNEAKKEFRKEFGAFWLRKSKSGNDFLTGKIEIPQEVIDQSKGHPVTVHIIGFKNRKKDLSDENDRSPYIHLFVDEKRESGAVELKAEILPD